jgi:hypothetical protein
MTPSGLVRIGVDHDQMRALVLVHQLCGALSLFGVHCW